MKKKRCKKVAALVLCLVMGCATVEQPIYAASTETSASDVEINFAKALQLSLYFYDANKCGYGITDGNLEWRGDCSSTAQTNGRRLQRDEFVTGIY